jgi:transposase
MSDESHISLPLDIANVKVLKTEIDDKGDVIITVESTLDEGTCRKCGRRITTFYGYDKMIRLRHLPILGQGVYICIRPKRYQCETCDEHPTTTQKCEWYDARNPHTHAYENHLLLMLVNSTIEDVSRKEQVGYDAVVGSLERRVQNSVDWETIDDLGVLGIDEISMRKGHQHYVAIVSTQKADGRVAILAVLGDRKKATVRNFLDSIPARLHKTMKSVCTDMWDAYIYAVREFEQAHVEVNVNIVIDRFHVAKAYHDAVDTLRKKEVRRLKKELPEADYASIKGAMWACRKAPEDLTLEERAKLEKLFEYAPDLKLAYTLREELTAIFERRISKDQGRQLLEAWQCKVRESGLSCFNRFLNTLNNWLEEIANYFLDRLSSGFVEGLNNKIKTLKRRCYGIFKASHLFQRIYLDLEGYRQFA